MRAVFEAVPVRKHLLLLIVTRLLVNYKTKAELGRRICQKGPGVRAQQTSVDSETADPS